MGRQPAAAVDYSEYSPAELEKMANEARANLDRIERAKAKVAEEVRENVLKKHADSKEWGALVKRINDVSAEVDKQKSGFTVRIPCELVVSVPNELNVAALQTMLQEETLDLLSADGDIVFPLQSDDIELVTASKNKLFRAIVQEIEIRELDNPELGLEIAKTYPEMRRLLGQIEKLHTDCQNYAQDVHDQTHDEGHEVWPEEVIRHMMVGLLTTPVLGLVSSLGAVYLIALVCGNVGITPVTVEPAPEPTQPKRGGISIALTCPCDKCKAERKLAAMSQSK